MTAVSSVTNTDSSQPVSNSSSSSSEKTDSAVSDFENIFATLVKPDSSSDISEEELFAATARDRIQKLKGDDAANKYDTALAANKSAFTKKGGFISYEEAATKALKDLVADGTLNQDDGNKIYSQAFAAAQLDSNSEKLYDGRGGKGDTTIAVAEKSKALASAQQIMEKIDKGDLEVSAKSLDTINVTALNTHAGAGAISTSASGEVSTQSAGGAVDGANGFLWKPASSKDGSLAVLLPEELAHKVLSLVLRDPTGKPLETGHSTGYGDLGTREKFAFSKPGASYPANLVVEATLEDGSLKTWNIADPSKRYD